MGKAPTQTRQMIKAIWLENARLGFENQKKLQGMKVASPQMAQAIKTVEQCKVQDQIYLKHGIRNNQLMAAMEHYGLQNDTDIKAFQQKFVKEVENEQKKK